MSTELSFSEKKVLMTLGAWTQQTIYSHHLHKVFFHKAARASVLVVASRVGYTQRYYYFYRWGKVPNSEKEFYVTSEFFDDHQPSLRACMQKVKAWEKSLAL